MSNKEALKALQRMLRARLENAFAEIVSTPEYKLLRGDEKMEGDLLTKVANVTACAVVDPTLRIKPDPVIRPDDVVELAPESSAMTSMAG